MKDMKEEIIAGIICILTIIKLYTHKVKYNTFCKKLGIKFGVITIFIK